MNQDASENKSSTETGLPHGVTILHDPTLNKGTAYTPEERDALGIRGLLPPRVFTEEEQLLRVMTNFRQKSSDLEKYIFLMSLQDRNETLFYHALLKNIEELMPIVYTPTVGEACKQYAHIWRRPRGMFISSQDRGQIRHVLQNWPERDVRIIVVTDGERILGLGDLGADGMGIPIGKLSLYTACAGVHPKFCLPITLDVGTNNDDLLDDPLYIGLKHRRLKGEDYVEFMDEFVSGVQDVFPRAVLQFEDFGNRNAFWILQKYRDRCCCFNDDIQGTAAVTLAGLVSASRITGAQIAEQRILFFGAGEAGAGIANLIVAAMVADGLSPETARERCYFFDSKGLVVKQRSDLQEHKIPFAHACEYTDDFLHAVETLKPTAIVGVSGQPQVFTEAVVKAMARHNPRPIIFALSNPTSKAECTAEQAYHWTSGTAVFASGSPFDPVEIDGQILNPGQANNAYIFPGVGLGLIATGARRVTDEMFMAAAKTLSRLASRDDLSHGCLFPRLRDMRKTSLEIAVSVARVAIDQQLASREIDGDMHTEIGKLIYEPSYEVYV